MSLKSQFKTDAAKVNDGVWFDVCTNEDGTKCRVKLRRAGRGNKRWSLEMREQMKGRNPDNIAADEDEQITANIFVKSSFVEWEHMQPEDDGIELESTEENAIKLLGDPDWVDLLSDWQAKASGLKPFQAKKEEEAKN